MLIEHRFSIIVNDREVIIEFVNVRGFRNNRKLNAYKAFNNFHPFTLSYDYYNIDYHICSCTLCDCEFFEEHTWILTPSNARIPIISNQYICAQCQTIRFN